MKYFIKVFAAVALVVILASPVAAEERKPGSAFRDCDTCPEMVVIPAGSFMMGSPSDEAGRQTHEGPRHRVRVKSFAIGKYEVTFAEWDVCVAAGGCTGYRPEDRRWGRGRQPVIYVSWKDAQAYVSWLSQKTGKRYRLPSEAEWEYAARAGTASARYWGAGLGRNNANCHGCGSRWDDKQTAPVGSFRPNRFGLRDVLGNVSEWVEDCWSKRHSGAPSDGRAWKTGNCKMGVLRGGSWKNFPKSVRSAYRDRFLVSFRNYYVGFRIARTF